MHHTLFICNQQPLNTSSSISKSGLFEMQRRLHIPRQIYVIYMIYIIYLSIYLYLHIYIYIYTYIYLHMPRQICSGEHDAVLLLCYIYYLYYLSNIYTHTHTHTHTHTYTHTHTHTHTHIHIYLHIPRQICSGEHDAVLLHPHTSRPEFVRRERHLLPPEYEHTYIVV